MAIDAKHITYQRNSTKKYPTYKIEAGLECKKILSTLSKPHGLQALMEQIIQEVQKGAKRFSPLEKKFSTSYSREDILQSIEVLLIDGIIQTKSKNRKPNKSNLEWELQLLYLDPRAREQVPQMEKLAAQNYENFQKQICEIIRDLKPSLLKDHLNRCIEQKELLTPNGEKVCGSEAWIKFQSVALTVAYALVLLEQGKQEPLRIVSERIWGKSKILDRYKKEIMLVTGESLSRLNLTNTPEVIFTHGDITYMYKGHHSSLLAGAPCCLIPETIQGMEIEHALVDKIFIIENMAVFQEIFFREYHKRPDVLLVWGAGYISSSKLHLLKKILQHHPVPVYIWSDLDSDGLGLTLDMVKKFRKYNVNAYPVLMGAAELDLAKGNYQAANYFNLDDPELYAIFPDVLERIKRKNVMEQEELLLYFDIWKEKLP